jgi:hypothetical protein
VSVTTTGAGPTPNPTVTLSSTFGKTVTAPIAVH